MIFGDAITNIQQIGTISILLVIVLAEFEILGKDRGIEGSPGPQARLPIFRPARLGSSVF